MAVPQEWGVPHAIEARAIPPEGFVIAVRNSRECLLFEGTEDHGGRRLSLSLGAHSDLRYAGGKTVSYLSVDGRRAARFNLDNGQVEVETTFPFGVGSHAYIGGEWVVARLDGADLFHRFSVSGERLKSFGSAKAAFGCPHQGWVGQVQEAILLKGTVATLGNDAFAFAYDFVPMVQAFRVTGEALWTTLLPGLEIPPRPTLEARWEAFKQENPGMKVSQGMLFPVNGDVSVGVNVAVFHEASLVFTKRRASLLGVAGDWLGTATLKKRHAGIFWYRGDLVAVGIHDAGTLRMDKVEIGTS